MSSKYLFAFILLLIGESGYSQVFDSLQFSQNLERAHWIQEYDRAAGIAVEELLKEDLDMLAEVLERPFYCEQKTDGTWIFSVGHTGPKGLQLAFQYEIKAGTLQSMDPLLLSPQLASYHRAYQQSRLPLDSILQEEGPRFRTYFFTDSLAQVHVLSFPTPDIFAPAVFGGQFHDVYDSTGKRLLSSGRMLLPSFFNVIVPEEEGLVLPYPGLDVPNVETICYVLEHTELLGTIKIATKNWVSYLAEDGSSWIHEFKPQKD